MTLSSNQRFDVKLKPLFDVKLKPLFDVKLKPKCILREYCLTLNSNSDSLNVVMLQIEKPCYKIDNSL